MKTEGEFKAVMKIVGYAQDISDPMVSLEDVDIANVVVNRLVSDIGKLLSIFDKCPYCGGHPVYRGAHTECGRCNKWLRPHPDISTFKHLEGREG